MTEPVMSTVAVTLPVIAPSSHVESDQTVEVGQCLLFFDGVCGLCSQSVDFVLARDSRQVFQFAPLQGETARQLLPSEFVNDLNSMVLLVQGRPFRKSSAVVRVLWQLGLCWRLLGTLLWLVPLPLRDIAYGFVARNRYRLFGKHDTCRMPTPAERARFLP
jgi:predicted DCC family thiol-disulfide oxidoreductase YuxK